MGHDQLFKELLREFFPEFIELFFPDVADQIDFSRVTALDKEMFTNFPEGKTREADTLTEVYTKSGEPELVLVHIEVESRRRAEAAFRMWEYFSLLRFGTGKPVFPILIYLAPGAGGLTTEHYTEEVFGHRPNYFEYAVVGLPDLNADDYQSRENPLAPALSALMRPGLMDSVSRKFATLLRVARAEVNDARRLMLANIIESYLKLSEAEETELAQRIVAQNGKEVMEMISIYEERGIAKGIERGLAQARAEAEQMVSIYEERGIAKGIERGLAQARAEAEQMVSIYEERGIAKGIERGLAQARAEAEQMVSIYEERGIAKGALTGQRTMLMKLLYAKFGEMPDAITAQIEQMDQQALDLVAERILTAQTLEEVLA